MTNGCKLYGSDPPAPLEKKSLVLCTFPNKTLQINGDSTPDGQ